MPYDPKAVANYFLQLAKKEGLGLSPLKLLKLVYIAHGWHLGLTDEPLLNEHPQAWKYGPVIPSLYHEFKIYGSGPISKPATELVEDPETGWSFDVVEVPPLNSKDDKNTCEFLDSIWSAYKNFSALELSKLTHQPSTPWSVTWDKRGKYIHGATIPEPEIIEHYRHLAKRDT